MPTPPNLVKFNHLPLILLVAGPLAIAADPSPPPVEVEPSPQPIRSLSTVPSVPAAPREVPTPSPARPAPQGLSQPTPGEEMVPRLEFPNTDVRDVLSFYERLTGKEVIFDNTVTGPITLVVTTPVPKSEAIRIIEAALLINGFSLVADRGNIVKVGGLAKVPRSLGVPIISDVAEIPDSDRVVTFLFKLQYADPTELQGVLAQYVPPSSYTSIVALPKSGVLMVTESSPVLRKVAQVVSEIDSPPAEVVSEFIKLERADVEDVIEKLEKIFEKEPSPQSGTTAKRAVQPPQVPGQPPQPEGLPPNAPSIEVDGGNILSEDSIIIGKIRLTADVRTNRIHVVTRPINLPFIRNLINEFDRDVKFGEPVNRKLRFVAAGDIFETIIQAVAEKGKDGETSVPQGAQGSGSNQTPSQSSFSLRNSTGFSSGSSGYSSGSGGLDVSEGLETEPRETTPIAVVVGTTKIIADRRTNSIIVLGNEEIKQKIFSLIDELDIRAPQVVISTVIGTYSRDLETDIGVDYFLGNRDVNSGTGTDDGDGDGDGNGRVGSTSSRAGIGITQTGVPFIDFARILTDGDLRKITPFLVGGSTGLASYAAFGNSLGVIVRALEQSGRFRVTQRPVVVTSNNKKAIIASGEEIAVPTQTLTNITDGAVVNSQAAVQSNVQFKQVTLQLEVVPLVNPQREVSLDILQKLDSLTGKFTEIGGNEIPTIATRYIRTSVSASSGATLILGGLIREEESETNTGIPYLSRIPVMGSLFKRKIKGKTRAELIILMQPRVIEGPEESADLTTAESEKVSAPADLDSTVDPQSGRRAKKVTFDSNPSPTPIIRVPR